MDLINFISFLDEMTVDGECICQNLYPVLTAVGYVIWGIKVVVPIALIVIGMVKLAKAVMSKDDGDIKKAQDSLVKKLIVSVVVFLVPTIVTIVMQAVGDKSYAPCWDSINHPGSIPSIFNWSEVTECN